MQRKNSGSSSTNENGILEKMIEAQNFVIPAAADEKRSITVHELTRASIYIEAHLIGRFKDSWMFVDASTGMPRLADNTPKNSSRYLTV